MIKVHKNFLMMFVILQRDESLAYPHTMPRTKYTQRNIIHYLSFK